MQERLRVNRGGASVAPSPLLATKLHAPRRRHEIVCRDRLSHRLDVARLPALTLVSAPAGFGKTTLLAEWAGDGDRAAAWLSLDARDSDPGLFWSYVVAALQTVAPDVGSAVLSLLRTSPPPPPTEVVEALLNDVAELKVEIVLVLDDYHVIGSREVHESVAFLVEHLPPSLRLVVASRADPPLPLARMRARGDLLELRASDLRFTRDEAASYLNGPMELDLDITDVDVLEDRTEGWIAALQLAALSMQGRDDVAGFIRQFAGDDRFVVDYLVEEVLERQSEEVRSFLLRTAILGRLTGPLCDAVTGTSGGKATLERLDRANLFLVPLDDRRRWYRYHHLFADLLQARLHDEHPDDVDELHRRASAWFAGEREWAPAIEHALAGHDAESAARLIEVAAPGLRQARQETALRRWLEALPADLFDDRPVLSLAFVGARMATGDPTGVEPMIERVERWLDAPANGAVTPIVFDHDELARLPAQAAVYRAALALLAGDSAATVAHARRVLASAGPSDHLLRGAASALIGLARWAAGDLVDAERRYSDAVQSFLDAEFIPDLLGCALALADIQIAQGRLRDARRTYESALRHAGDHGVLRGTADMHAGASEVLVEQDELDDAEHRLRICDGLGDVAGLPQNPYRRRVAAALLLRARGDLDGALGRLEEAAPLYDTDFSPAVRPIAALAARTQLARGDLAAAERWAAESGVGIDDELGYVREFEHITLARTLLARRSAPRDEGAVDDVVAFLERLLGAAEAGGRGSAVEILVLLAAAHDSAGDRPAAAAALERALALAAPERAVRVFVDGVPSLEPLLRAISVQGPAHDHLRRVLAAAGATEAAAPARGSLVDELSGRELDVLRLLRSDVSGPDIARELHVSLNTLRTHTKSIYSKLGVTSRRSAVRRAGELGL